VCLELVSKKMSEGMSWGSYGTSNRSKWYVFLMDFGLSIDPWGLGVVMNDMFLDVGFQGRRLNGFGDQVSDSVNRVFGKLFIRREGENVHKFGVILSVIHYNNSISFISFEDDIYLIFFKIFSFT